MFIPIKNYLDKLLLDIKSAKKITLIFKHYKRNDNILFEEVFNMPNVSVIEKGSINAIIIDDNYIWHRFD